MNGRPNCCTSQRIGLLGQAFARNGLALASFSWAHWLAPLPLLFACLSGESGLLGPDASVAVSDASVAEPDASVLEVIPVEIGKGETTFEPLMAGETLPYVAGGQGGFHVFVGFSVSGLDSMRVLTEVTTRVEGYSDLVLTRAGRLTLELVDGAPGVHRYVGWPAEILDAHVHEGERVVIDVALEDRAGQRAVGQRTIVIGTLL